MEPEKLNLMQELLLRYCGQRGMTDVEITGRATVTRKRSSPMETSPMTSGEFTSSRPGGKTVSRRSCLHCGERTMTSKK